MILEKFDGYSNLISLLLKKSGYELKDLADVMDIELQRPQRCRENGFKLESIERKKLIKFYQFLALTLFSSAQVIPSTQH